MASSVTSLLLALPRLALMLLLASHPTKNTQAYSPGLRCEGLSLGLKELKSKQKARVWQSDISQRGILQTFHAVWGQWSWTELWETLEVELRLWVKIPALPYRGGLTLARCLSYLIYN